MVGYERINKQMKKTLTAIVVAAAMICVLLCGCGVDVQTTSTNTTTTTNADGSTTTTTTTTSNNNGQVSQTTTTTTDHVYYEAVPVTLINDTDFDFYGLYICSPSDESMGENVCESLENSCLESGKGIKLSFSFYSDDPYYDFRIVDEDGAYVDFADMYLGECTEVGTIIFSTNDDGSYNMHIEPVEFTTD